MLVLFVDRVKRLRRSSELHEDLPGTNGIQETGPTVYRPHPRRLECLSCRCHYKGSTFSSVILRP